MGKTQKRLKAALAWGALILLAGTALFLWVRLGEARRQVSLERKRCALAESSMEKMESRIASLRREVEGLWEQLDQAREEREGREKILDEIEKRLSTRAEQAPSPAWRERLARARAMIPLTAALNRCLRLSGYSRLRFFSIEGREGKALLGADLHHLDPTGLVDHVVRAEKLYLTLDPARKELRLTSPKGKELVERKWVPFGREGWDLVLPGVDPEPWKHLGYSVLEILPEPPPRPASRPLFSYWERRLWMERFAGLLEGEPSLQGHVFRLVGLGGLTPKGFREVELLGYTRKGLLVERFRARELRVERAAGKGVRFVLTDGIHESSLGKSSLPPAGFLLFFPGAEPSEWARTLEDRFLDSGQKGS